jgi:molecular chaperone GrpE
MSQNTDNEISEENDHLNDQSEVNKDMDALDESLENDLDSVVSENNKEEASLDNSKTESLEEELRDTKDKLLRSLAENENVRKQIDKIRQEGIKYGVQPLAREVISIVDNFDRALSAKSESKEKDLEEGVTLIKKDILSILDKFSIIKIDALGENFDANYHQAMFEKETNEFDSGKVCEIVQEGYKFHERLLRPVLVGVAKKMENKEDIESDIISDQDKKEVE